MTEPTGFKGPDMEWKGRRRVEHDSSFGGLSNGVDGWGLPLLSWGRLEEKPMRNGWGKEMLGGMDIKSPA